MDWKFASSVMKTAGGNRCALCDSTKRLQVHHWTYKRTGKEQVRDLLVVCDSCHELIHSIGNEKKLAEIAERMSTLFGRQIRVEKNHKYGPIKAKRIVSKIREKIDRLSDCGAFCAWCIRMKKQAESE
jgi:hypothetical protein